MSMRHDIRFRAGSALLGLLLLVHLGSGLLHPCCLGGEHAVVAEHAGAGPDHVTASVRGMGGHAHGGGSDQGAEHAPGGHNAHDQGDSRDGGSDGCEGTCGLCCQTLDHVAVAASPPAAVVHAAPRHAEPASPALGAARSAPDFLLPFANAPPESSTLHG